MKYLKLTILFCLTSLILLSCQDDDKQRRAEAVKARKQNDSILKYLSNNWKFNVQPASAKVQEKLATWNEWQQFKTELQEKPAGSIESYRQKTQNLAAKADQLRNNIPPFFDKPQVRSRISVLITKMKSLYTYTNVSVIPEKKVVGIINDITKEANSLQRQLNELVVRSEIPKEMGEEEMLRALDTVRHANPEMMPQEPQTQTQPQPNPARQTLNPRLQGKPQKLKPAN